MLNGLLGLLYLSFALYSADIRAVQIDWVAATSGIRTEVGIGYSGCFPAESMKDVRSRNASLMRARANIARSRSATISGIERLSSKNEKGAVSIYSLSVVERSDDFVFPITVIKEEMVVIDGVSNVCVLVVEQKPGV